MKKKTAVLAILLGAVSIALLAGLMTAGAETRPEDLSQPESVLPAESSVPAGGEAEPKEEPVQEAPVPADYSGWRQWTAAGPITAGESVQPAGFSWTEAGIFWM